MTNLMERALSVIGQWPDNRQDEAAEILLALNRLGLEPYPASDDELKAIDSALEEVRRGTVTSEAEVESAFARFRG